MTMSARLWAHWANLSNKGRHHTTSRLADALRGARLTWQDRRDRRQARDPADGSPFWGDTGHVGDLHAAQDFPGPSLSASPAPAVPRSAADRQSPAGRAGEAEPIAVEVIDHDLASAAIHYWARQARINIGLPPDAAVPARAPVLTAAPPVSRTPTLAVETGNRPGVGEPAASTAAPPAGTSYDVLYAMATAVNDAWLDRLFARAA